MNRSTTRLAVAIAIVVLISQAALAQSVVVNTRSGPPQPCLREMAAIKMRVASRGLLTRLSGNRWLAQTIRRSSAAVATSREGHAPIRRYGA